MAPHGDEDMGGMDMDNHHDMLNTADTTTPKTLAAIQLTQAELDAFNNREFSLFDKFLTLIDIRYGHWVPALFVFTWSSWGIFNMFCRMHRKRMWKVPYLSQTCYLWMCMNGIPYMSIFKLFVGGYSTTHYLIRATLMTDAITASGKMINHYKLRQYHHAIMLGSFTIQFALEVLRQSRIRHYLMPSIPYYMLTLGFWIEMVVFKFHLDDRYNFEVQIHRVQMALIFMTLLAAWAETYFRQSYWPALLRWHCLMGQGVWLFVEELATTPEKLGLNKNFWSHKDPNSVNYVAPVFAFSNVCTMLLLGAYCAGAYFAVKSKWFDELAMPAPEEKMQKIKFPFAAAVFDKSAAMQDDREEIHLNSGNVVAPLHARI